MGADLVTRLPGSGPLRIVQQLIEDKQVVGNAEGANRIPDADQVDANPTVGQVAAQEGVAAVSYTHLCV